jgi:hypothetical protein
VDELKRASPGVRAAKPSRRSAGGEEVHGTQQPSADAAAQVEAPVKRTLVLFVAVATVAGGAVSASAAPAKPKAKPVAMTHYFHGTEQLGELQSPPVVGSGYAKMDATAPTGTSARSSGVTNYVGGPNTECAGNSLFPVWVGAVDGTPTGDATVELFLQTAGSGSFEVRLFADVTEQACNEAYPGAIASETVTFTNGQTTAKVLLKKINPKGKPLGSLMVQVTPVLGPPYIARVQYDATSAASRISFSCLPKAGKKTC